MRVTIEAETDAERELLEGQGRQAKESYGGLIAYAFVGRTLAGPVFRQHFNDPCEAIGDLAACAESIRWQVLSRTLQTQSMP